MLSKEAFKIGLKKLNAEYANKGFIMSKDRVTQWYGYMRGMSETEFNTRIDYVLKTCCYSPCIADILKAKVNVRRKDIEDMIL